MPKQKAETQRNPEIVVKSVPLPISYVEALERIAEKQPEYRHLPAGRRFSAVVREIIRKHLLRIGEVKE